MVCDSTKYSSDTIKKKIMKKCNCCGAQIEDGNQFCTECGKPFLQGKSCPHCGVSVSDDDAFCKNCRNRFLLPSR